MAGEWWEIGQLTLQQFPEFVGGMLPERAAPPGEKCENNRGIISNMALETRILSPFSCYWAFANKEWSKVVKTREVTPRNDDH